MEAINVKNGIFQRNVTLNYIGTSENLRILSLDTSSFISLSNHCGTGNIMVSKKEKRESLYFHRAYREAL